jgi:hypothetical protein
VVDKSKVSIISGSEPGLPGWVREAIKRVRVAQKERDAFNAQWRTDPDSPDNPLFDAVTVRSRNIRRVGLTEGIVTDLLLGRISEEWELREMTDEEILRIPYIGPKRLIKIRAAIQAGHPFFGEVRSELEGMGSVNERWGGDE